MAGGAVAAAIAMHISGIHPLMAQQSSPCCLHLPTPVESLHPVAMPQVPVMPVPMATPLSLALVAAGLLVFLLAALKQRWHRHP